MITDILSGAGAGLSPLSLLPQASLQSQFQRIPSPHDSDSSDAGSNKDHDISDDGDDGKSYNNITTTTPHIDIDIMLQLKTCPTVVVVYLMLNASDETKYFSFKESEFYK